jgi:predicted nucleotidyltransferase
MLPTKHEVGNLRRSVRQVMHSENQSLDDLLQSSSDLVVFGSRASGLQRHNSDLDVLIVGEKRARKRIGSLDLIFVPEYQVQTLAYKHTELFRHIEAYGISLMHDQTLIAAVYDDYAALRKRLRLEALSAKVVSVWDILTDGLRLKYLTKLRREVQRYRILERGLAVPPTAQLDSCIDSIKSVDLILEDLIVIVRETTTTAKGTTSQLFVNEAHRLRKHLVSR